jgi:hypothetical protein
MVNDTREEFVFRLPETDKEAAPRPTGEKCGAPLPVIQHRFGIPCFFLITGFHL